MTTETIFDNFEKTVLETCDIWDTENYDNGDPGFMTIFSTWQLIVTLDSIRNSCNVLWHQHKNNVDEFGNRCFLLKAQLSHKFSLYSYILDKAFINYKINLIHIWLVHFQYYPWLKQTGKTYIPLDDSLIDICFCSHFCK